MNATEATRMHGAGALTGVERRFGEQEILVSKTDLAGRVTYANRVFLRIAGYDEDEILGQAHSIIRHPDMPRCVFHFLWERIEAGHEVFAYVVNRASNGDHYWVLAHVTPTFNADGRIVGYHSNRRCPERAAIDAVAKIYAALRAEEEQHDSRKAAIAAGRELLDRTLADAGVTYDEFVFSL